MYIEIPIGKKFNMGRLESYAKGGQSSGDGITQAELNTALAGLATPANMAVASADRVVLHGKADANAADISTVETEVHDFLDGTGTDSRTALQTAMSRQVSYGNGNGGKIAQVNAAGNGWEFANPGGSELVAWSFTNNGLDLPRDGQSTGRAHNDLPDMNLPTWGNYVANGPPRTGGGGVVYVKHSFANRLFFAHNKTVNNGVTLTPHTAGGGDYNGVVRIDQSGYYMIQCSATLKCTGADVQNCMRFGLVSIVKLRDQHDHWDGTGSTNSNSNGGEAPDVSDMGGLPNPSQQYLDHDSRDHLTGSSAWMNNTSDPNASGLYKSGWELARGYSEAGLPAKYANLVDGSNGYNNTEKDYAHTWANNFQTIHVTVTHCLNLENGDRIVPFFSGGLNGMALKGNHTNDNTIGSGDGDIAVARRTLSWSGYRLGDTL